MMGHSATGTTGRHAWMRRAINRGFCLSLVGIVAAVPMACSGDDSSGGKGATEPPDVPTAEVTVEVSFPSEAAENVTSSLHVWVLVPNGDAGVTCADLIGGTVDPYDLVFDRHGDAVETSPEGSVTAAEVELGRGLVYVEAVDVEGNIEYAGCGDIDVARPSTTKSLDLKRARVFDCEDPKTEDGAPCDDGDVCTVGETCDGGECRGGTSRNCSFLSTTCNAVSCDPEMGCVAEPLEDGTPCSDDLYCTTGEECADGECVGLPRDCDAEARECQTSLGCNEALDQCEFDDAPSGTSCDDGQYCTENDECDFFGNCIGTQRDCSAGGCQVGSCNEALQACETEPVAEGTFCDDDDACTTSDQCDSTGTCVGTARDCSYLDSGCTAGMCDPLVGCTAVDLPSGSTCDDGDPCTEEDTCDAFGSCSGTMKDCSSLDTECEIGTCNTSTGACQATDRTSGTSCDDGDPCTTGEYCLSGTCGNGTPVVTDGGSCL